MPELSVDADLRLQVTSPAGESTTAVVTASGREVRVDVERPEVLLATVDRTDVGRVADLLAASGVTVRVMGPDGPAATIGAGTSSRFGKFITGSSAVAPAPRAAAGLALSNPALQVVAIAVPVLLAVLAAFRRRRRG